jgi:putative selenium metabolism protein SsnA
MNHPSLPTDRTVLIENGTLLSTGGAPSVRRNCSVLIEAGLVTRVAPAARFGEFAGRRLDAAGKVVIPGLINTHTHLYRAFARGLAATRRSRDFLAVLRNLWWRFDAALTPEDCYQSALVGLLDAIRHGGTAVVDHHSSPGAPAGSLDQLARAVRETGVRACLCYEVSDRGGPEGARAGLAENSRFIHRCQAEGGAELRALFGLHASFTLSDTTLAAASALGQESQTGFHLHVAEARADQRAARRTSAKAVVERLGSFGILGPRTLAAHCIHLSRREIDLLAQTGTAVAHNPQSNLDHGVGVAAVPEMMRRGVLVGLGTDAMTGNLLEELRVALWSQHLATGNPSAGFEAATGTLFRGNAAIAGRIFGLRFGEVRAGFAGDLAIFDYDPPTPLAGPNALAHVLFGLSQAPVDSTIVGGRVLMEHRRLTLGLDEARVHARARELAKRLWKRL